MIMRYPEFLKEKGTIGFVAPSFGCVTEPYFSAFKNALERFKSMGYGTDIGANCYADKGMGISNTPEECARELTEMYLSKDNDVLISCGGGEMMCKILEHMDFELLKSVSPKWFLGYSDNTNFVYPSTVILDTASVYGQCAPTFGMREWDNVLYDTWGILTGKKTEVSGFGLWEKESLKSADNPLEPYNLTEKKELVLYEGEKRVVSLEMHGRLIGGCLDSLLTLAGTGFDRTKDFIKKYRDDGILWFLESCDLSVLQMNRGLWQLKNCGWFEGANGFIIGRPLHFDDTECGFDRHNAVLDVLSDIGVPICMDADIGHLPPSMPIVSGAIADVTCNDNIHIKYSFE